MKMTLQEYLSTIESEDGKIDERWKNHFIKYLPSMLSEDETKEHLGDCTRHSCPCTLCQLERMLKEYREYFFDIKSED